MEIWLHRYNESMKKIDVSIISNFLTFYGNRGSIARIYVVKIAKLRVALSLCRLLSAD